MHARIIDAQLDRAARGRAAAPGVHRAGGVRRARPTRSSARPPPWPAARSSWRTWPTRCSRARRAAQDAARPAGRASPPGPAPPVVRPAAPGTTPPRAGWSPWSGARGEDWGRLIMVRGGPAAPARRGPDRARRHHAGPRAAARPPSARAWSARPTGPSWPRSSATATPTRPRPRRGPGRSASRSPAAACWPCVVRLSHGDRPASRRARPARWPDRRRSVADGVPAAQRVPALVAALDDSRVAALLALAAAGRRRRRAHRAGRAAAAPAAATSDVIGAGSVVESVPGCSARSWRPTRSPAACRRPGLPGGRALLPAARPAAARPAAPAPRRPAAAGVRRAGARAAAAATTPRAASCSTALTAYLEAGGNKAEAAKRAHLARPTLYERLRQIEAVLGISLEPAESRLSLHVALLAHTVLADRGVREA